MRKKMQNKVVIFMTKTFRFVFHFAFYFTHYLLKNFMFGPFGSCLLLCINLTEGRVFLEMMKVTYLPICYLPNKIVKDTFSDPSPYKNRKRTVAYCSLQAK